MAVDRPTTTEPMPSNGNGPIIIPDAAAGDDQDQGEPRQARPAETSSIRRHSAILVWGDGQSPAYISPPLMVPNAKRA